ncbi:MAG: hypothetical protein EA367_03520 [Leptolyngbya sp. DLM2.Bin15]|nr:MAG: hypothetical protein EA367_03520 [Leptolyngbya sp. DLM2.Bin15]
MNPEPFVNPPLFTLIMISNFLAIIFGIIFKDMLEYQVAIWDADRSVEFDVQYKTPKIIITYLGLTLFTTIFMGSSLCVFGLPLWFGFALGAIVVLPTCGLLWLQMGSMLRLMAIGGSAAIDIDIDYSDRPLPSKPDA